MHLKSLSIHGFKSFADPTDIVLERGLTAIVGPNGCGKSNVIDAIRWALGEQSARSLRGATMQDIIFNGGGRRGPLGMAEVTLRFSNRDRVLSVDRDEVRVTRRLYRDGGSEYEINGQKSRLRDIRELLMDTGAGASAAVFVEQGKIDALLHASPKERRHVLEEAAGIGKYKVRKKDAQNRLGRVAVDRARLLDILKEVTDRFGKLKRQAQKAKRYVELREKLQGLQLELARHQGHRLAGVLKTSGAKSATARDEAAALAEQLAALEVEVDLLKGEVKERGSTERELELSLRDLGASERVRREQLQQEGRRAAECNDDASRIEYQLKQLRAKAERLEKEIAAGTDAIEQQKEADEGRTERLEEAEQALAALDHKVERKQKAQERSRSKLMDALQEEARLRNRATELDARSRVLSGREERLARKLGEVERVLADRKVELDAIDKEIADAAARLEAIDTQLDQLTDQREDAEGTIRDLEESFLEDRRALDQIDARLAVLDQLDKEGQGLDPGVKAVAELQVSGPPEGSDLSFCTTGAIVGALADQLAVDPDFAPAIEALLGETAQWILTRTEDAARALAEHLEAEEIGRATFVPLERYLEEVDASGPPKLSEAEQSKLDDAGFLGWASELAGPATEARGVIQHALRGAVICDDLEAAEALCKLPAVTAAATLEGAVLYADGRLTGGPALTGGRLGRRSERLALEQDRKEQEERLDQIRVTLSDKKAEEKAAAAQLEELRHERQEKKLVAFGLKRDREERERTARRLREESRLTGDELAEIQADRSNSATELEEVEREAIVLREEAAEHEERAKELQESLRELDDERQAARQRLELAKVEAARLAAEWQAKKRAAERAAAEKVENDERLAELAEALEQARSRKSTAKETREAIEQELKRLVEAQEADHKALATVQKELEARRKKLVAHTKAQEKAEIKQRRARTEAERSGREAREAQTRLEGLAKRVQDDLGMTLAQLEPPSEREAGAPRFNEDDAEKAIVSARGQINLIGAVNLEALEECAELEERKDTLEKQTTDLAKAEENLRQTIKRLNETSRKLFNQTFTAVKGHFKEIFRRLFGGGQADLKLEPGVDVLEAGVDIIARPPGKKARTISLLSGGEKVLATVALLFAVFRAKPGPFCILDEVDAALDEHNVGRFVSLVRGFLDHSQFLIVTHNKKTMSAADALYGVTMPEPGVSTPVGVRLTTRSSREDPVAAVKEAEAAAQKDATATATVAPSKSAKAPAKAKSARAKTATAKPAKAKPAKAKSSKAKTAKAKSAKAKSARAKSSKAKSARASGRVKRTAKARASQSPTKEPS